MIQGLKVKGIWICLIVLTSLMACNQARKPKPEIDRKLAAKELKDAFDLKNQYLVEANYEALSNIIHSDAVYGHSNCWIQDKEDITGVTPEDSLSYLSIKANDLNIDVIGSTGIIQGTAQFKGVYKLDTFDLHLCFVETYAHLDNSWKLVARQSAGVPKK